MNIISGIYKIINPENKIYIGESSNINKRWKTYKRLEDVKTQPKLYNSLKDHGWEKHKWEIIEEIYDTNIRKHKEEYYISLYDSYNNGLNSSSKSKGPSSQTIETRLKIGIGNKIPKPNSGGKGKPKPHTKEHNQNISKALLGYKQSEQHKINRSKSTTGHRNKPGKIIIQYDLNMNKINEYKSANEAGRCINKSGNQIADCASGRQKTAFNFKWKYKN
jgi:group I intron endonuclease